MGHQVTHASEQSPSYDPASQVSNLFSGGRPVAANPVASPPASHDTSVSSGNHSGSEGAGAASGTLAVEPIAPRSESPQAAVQVDASVTASQSPAGHTGGSSTSGLKAATAARSENATTNSIVKTLNAAQPPPAGGTLSYSAGPKGSNLTLTLDAHNLSQFDLISNSTGVVVASSPLDQVNRVVVTGANNANDTLTVDMTNPFWLSGGVSFSGGAGTADVTDGSHSTLISFTGLELVVINQTSGFTFSLSLSTTSSPINVTIGSGSCTNPTT